MFIKYTYKQLSTSLQWSALARTFGAFIHNVFIFSPSLSSRKLASQPPQPGGLALLILTATYDMVAAYIHTLWHHGGVAMIYAATEKRSRLIHTWIKVAKIIQKKTKKKFKNKMQIKNTYKSKRSSHTYACICKLVLHVSNQNRIWRKKAR